jgi:hypothetical protein
MSDYMSYGEALSLITKRRRKPKPKRKRWDGRKRKLTDAEIVAMRVQHQVYGTNLDLLAGLNNVSRATARDVILERGAYKL